MFNPSTPTPTITDRHVHSTRDGYVVEVFCLLDGYPGRIEMSVNTDQRRYSTFTASAFNPDGMCWDSVYSLDPEVVGHVGVLPSLTELNNIAMRLWVVAENALTVSRRRQAEVDVDLAVMRETAILAREARMRETAQVSRFDSTPDPDVSTDDDTEEVAG